MTLMKLIAILSMALLATCATLASAQVPQPRIDHTAPVQGDEWMNRRMGPGSDMLYTSQQLQPEGQMLDFGGRLCSIALARGGKFILIKTSSQLVSVDADAFKGVQHTDFPNKNGGSMHGLAVSSDGATAYVTGGKDRLFVVDVAADGTFKFSREINLAEGGKSTNPLGVALTPDGKQALVARSITNDIVLLNLATGKIAARVPVGICPYSVAITKDGRQAFVSNYGGRRPHKGEKTEPSAGSDVAVDAQSMPLTGTVSVLDLTGTPRQTEQIIVGLHPSELLLAPDQQHLYVSNVGSDSVSVIDPATRRVVATLDTKADPSMPWGSLSDGLALSADGQMLYVANAGINAIACIQLDKPSQPLRLIPAGWYPGRIVRARPGIVRLQRAQRPGKNSARQR